MRNKPLVLFSVLLVFLLVTSPLSARGKKKLAVPNFTDTAAKVSGTGVSAANYINDLLVGMGRVDVMERQHLAQILKEQALSLTGIIDASTAASVGKLLGVNYLVIGSVSDASVTTSIGTKKDKEGKSKKVKTIRGRTSVHLRIVDVEKGNIIYSQTKTGTKTRTEDYKEPAKKSDLVAVVEAVAKVSEEKEDPNVTYSYLVMDSLQSACKAFNRDLLNVFRIAGVIIQIIDDRNVVIDLGEEDGVKKGNMFKVCRRGEAITHPTTGELIPGALIELGLLKVHSVSKNASNLKVHKKIRGRVKVGDEVKSTQAGGGCCLFRPF